MKFFIQVAQQSSLPQGARSTDAGLLLLSRTDLFHLNAHMEGIGKNLDELAEVHTFVSDVIEDSLVAVSLIFYITYFHLQSEIFGYLAALDHGAVFTALSLLAFVKIHLFGDTVDTLDIILRLEVCLLNLEFYQSSGQRNHTDVVTRVSLLTATYIRPSSGRGYSHCGNIPYGYS